MSKRKLEAKEWLKDVGFSDADVESMAAKFTAPQLEKIAEGYMRQDDYDSSMNAGKSDLDKLRAQLTDSEQRLNDEMLAWGELKNKDTQAAAAIQTRLDAAQQDVLKLTQTIERVATAAGMDPTAILKEAQVVVPTPTNTPPNTPAPANLDGYVKSDQFGTALDNLAYVALRTPAALMKIAREHRTLTGEDIDPDVVITEIQTRASTRGNTKSLDPIKVWEEKFDIPAKRAAKQEADINQRVADAEKRGRENALSEVNLPGQHTPAGRNPSPLNLGNRQSVFSRPQPGTAVNAGVAALRSGKYRPAGATKSA